MTIAITIYYIIGILWALYCLYMQHKLHGKESDLQRYFVIALLNGLFWPVSMIFAFVNFKKL